MTATTTTPSATRASAAGHVSGILLMLAAGVAFVIMDATGKHLTASLSVTEIT